jgi:hypothetical protein
MFAEPSVEGKINELRCGDLWLAGCGCRDLVVGLIPGSDATPEDYQSIAVHFENDKNHFLAGKFFLLSEQYVRVRLMIGYVLFYTMMMIMMMMMMAGKFFLLSEQYVRVRLMIG